MPWSTPDLRTVRSLVRDSIQAYLPGADAMVPNSVLRVLSDNQGAVCHLTLQYLDWLALQLIPDTAEQEWLDRHGDIWLVNADGSTGRKSATFSTGTVNLTGVAGTVVPANTQLVYSSTLFGYETTEQIFLAESQSDTPVAVRALDPGSLGNLEPGTTLAVSISVNGLDGIATVVSLETGTDEETDDDLRIRVLERIRQPPMGGAAYDYVAWAKAVGGVTRAWANVEMGIGTITVRFMCDRLRATSNNGFPLDTDITSVTNYVNFKRPVTTKDCWVLAPIPEFIDVRIANLNPDNDETRAAILQSLLDMLLLRAAPGQTIFAAWKYYAIMQVANIISFDLQDSSDDIMPSIGHMAVLGNVFYDAGTTSS
jgi:uncharacterized phage protein gp47/JayE